MSGLGPYADAEVHDAGDVAHPPWRLLGPGDVPERVRAVRVALAGTSGGQPVPVRVAASIAQLGLVARLVAPVLASVAVTGRGPLLTAAAVWWQPFLGGPFPLSLPSGDADAADAVPVLLGGLARDLTEAVASLSVSRKLLWGNVASAVNGAAGQLAARRPELSEAAVAAAGLFLRHPSLAEASTGDPLLDFRRRSCCLIYRLADRRSICGDCILAG